MHLCPVDQCVAFQAVPLESVEHPRRALPLDDALRLETRIGLEVIASGETLEGATRFARGAGRHGSFEG